MRTTLRAGAAGLVFAAMACGVVRSQAPAGVDDRLRGAEEALEKNDLKSAAVLLTKLAEERPGDAHVLFDLGYADEGLNDTAGARTAYGAAITANPELGEAHVALGLLLARTGTGARAEVETQLRAGAANEKTPTEVRARALRALASLEETSAPGKASDDLLLAVKLTHETEPDIVESADLALAAGDLPDAEVAYRRALALERDDVTATTGLGQTLRREGKLVEADEVLTGGLARHPAGPMNIGVLASLAAVKAGENKPEDAVALLEPLIPAGSAGKNPLLARELARLYGMTGQGAKAETLYGELVTITPDDPALLDDYADVLVRAGKFAPAEAMLTRGRGEPERLGEGIQLGRSRGAPGVCSLTQPPSADDIASACCTCYCVAQLSPRLCFSKRRRRIACRTTRKPPRDIERFWQRRMGKFPDEEFEARHRLVALEHTK